MWWCLTHTLPEAYARASAAAAAYEDDGRGEESVRLLNEVISASRMVDLFINALHPFLAPSRDRFYDTSYAGSQMGLGFGYVVFRGERSLL